MTIAITNLFMLDLHLNWEWPGKSVEGGGLKVVGMERNQHDMIAPHVSQLY